MALRHDAGQNKQALMGTQRLGWIEMRVRKAICVKYRARETAGSPGWRGLLEERLFGRVHGP
jgi:hypothetical protein